MADKGKNAIGDYSWERTLHDIEIRASQLEQATQKTAQGSEQQSRRYLCVKKISVSSPDQLDIGDHVVFHRFSYDHHGIITDKDGCRFEVAEATKESLGGEVKLTCSWKRFENPVTGVSKVDYSHYSSKQQTAQRAKDSYENIKANPGSYKYKLFTNNCEHFATYCATGEMYSQQVEEFLSLDWISFIKSKIGKKDGNQTVCIPCRDIKNNNDFKKRDIIDFYLDGNRFVLTLT